MNVEEALKMVLHQCPTGHRDRDCCALDSLQRLPPEELEAILSGMTPEQSEETFKKHLLCLCKQGGCEVRD